MTDVKANRFDGILSYNRILNGYIKKAFEKKTMTSILRTMRRWDIAVTTACANVDGFALCLAFLRCYCVAFALLLRYYCVVVALPLHCRYVTDLDRLRIDAVMVARYNLMTIFYNEPGQTYKPGQTYNKPGQTVARANLFLVQNLNQKKIEILWPIQVAVHFIALD